MELWVKFTKPSISGLLIDKAADFYTCLSSEVSPCGYTVFQGSNLEQIMMFSRLQFWFYSDLCLFFIQCSSIFTANVLNFTMHAGRSEKFHHKDCKYVQRSKSICTTGRSDYFSPGFFLHRIPYFSVNISCKSCGFWILSYITDWEWIWKHHG